MATVKYTATSAGGATPTPANPHGGFGTNQANIMSDSKCNANAAIWNSYNTCGTITRSNIGLATPADLDDIFKDTNGNYRDMTHLLTAQMELKTCGQRQYGMYDWLMSGAKSMGNMVNTKKVQGGSAEVDPFILAAQKDIIKDNYWRVERIYTSGAANNKYKSVNSSNALVAEHADGQLIATPGGDAANYNILKLKAPSNGNQPITAQYFPKGAHLFMFAKDTSGDSFRLEFEVIQSVGGLVESDNIAYLSEDTEFVDVEVKLIGGYGAGAAVTWDADMASGTSKEISKANTALVVQGVNNINDFERWCENRPALNTLKHVPFWYQTSRYTTCVDQFYKEWLEKMMATNQFFQKFGDVPLAERNRQLGLMFQKEWVNAFFWGQPIGSSQTLSGYKNLDQIKSYPGLGGTNLSELTTGMEQSLIGYRANAVGVYRQLQDCGRVVDKQGAQLNLETDLFNKIFDLVRSRKDQGKPADSIDVFTDTKTARQIFKAMVDYYKAEGLDNVNADIGSSNLFGGFYTQSYMLHNPAGVQMNIITNEFFDDMVTTAGLVDTLHASNAEAAVAKKNGSQGRFLMILDLGGGVYPGIIGSNRKVHTTGNLEDLARVNTDYACVMENPTREITLNSQTWTAIVECPSDNLIIENFDNTKPANGN